MNLFNVGLVRGVPVSRTYKSDCCWVSYLIKLMKWLWAFMKRSAAMNSQRSYSETFNYFCWVWKFSRRHMSQMMSYTWITCFPEKFDYTSFLLFWPLQSGPEGLVTRIALEMIQRGAFPVLSVNEKRKSIFSLAKNFVETKLKLLLVVW